MRLLFFLVLFCFILRSKLFILSSIHSLRLTELVTTKKCLLLIFDRHININN